MAFSMGCRGSLSRIGEPREATYRVTRGGTTAGKLLCLQHSLHKVKEFAELEDGLLMGDWPGAEGLDKDDRLDRLPEHESRLKGCKRVGVCFTRICLWP